MNLRVLLMALVLGAGAFLAGTWVGDCKVEGYQEKCQARWFQLRTPRYWWTSKTSWEETRGGVRYVFGVGKVTGVLNQALRATAAESRARAAVAKALAGEALNPNSRVQVTLAGCESISQYDEPCNGTMFALVRCPR